MAFAAAILSSAAQGLLREESRPEFTSSMTLEGSTHTEHTTGKYGEFMHPFRQVAPEVQTIYYPESKTISKKLHRVQGPSRHHAQNEQSRAIGGKQRKKSEGIWDTLKSWVSPFGGDMYTTPMTNYWNLLYLGEIYMGSD